MNQQPISIPIAKAVDGIGKVSSVVALVFEAKLAPGLMALYQQIFQKPYPDSLSDAILLGEKEVEREWGPLLWKMTLRSGINLRVTGAVQSQPSVTVINKNDLMKEIIEKKDRIKMESYRTIFTENELKLLEDKLKSTPPRKNKNLETGRRE